MNDIGDRIIQAESAGNPNAQNPRSSAGGSGQFIDSTWLNTIKKHRPDLAAKYSTSELKALKFDAGLNREMTHALASDNGEYLSGRGFDASPGNVYLAHFAGPGAAASILRSSPETPVSRVMSPEALKANPFLANMTVADLQKWAAGKVGAAPQPGAPPQAPSFAPGGTGALPPSPMPPFVPGATQEATQQPGAPAANPMAALLAPPPPIEPVKPVHIDTPVPPGIARAQALARAMAQLPLTGGQG